MKKMVCAAVAVAVIVLGIAAPSQARGHHFRGHVSTRVFIGAGVWGPPWWWDPWPYYYPPYAYAPAPVVVQEQPPVYVQQPAPAPPPPPAAPSDSYWYYCEHAKGYYPSVQQCPEGWIRVAPRAPAQ